MKKFQYYPAHITSNRPKGWVTLDQFIQGTKNPRIEKQNIFHQIALAEAEGNNELKARLKQENLFYFTPAVHLDGFRKYDNITGWTGLMVLDFDHLDSRDYSIQFKSFLFDEYPSIIASWISPSGMGVKCLVQIPVVESVDQFKSYFYGIAAELHNYQGFDPSGQNCVLPLFQSYDPDILFRETDQVWDITGIKQNEFKPISGVNVKKGLEKPSEVTTMRIRAILSAGFRNIIDVGHPNVRGLSMTAGGFVGAGYWDASDAVDFLCEQIDDHPYLSAKSDGYKKTALWGVNLGQVKPIYLD